jgi:hypothetical protein
MGERLKQFQEFRQAMNERIRSAKNLNINRFFTLDGAAYKPGALEPLTKEMDDWNAESGGRVQ